MMVSGLQGKKAVKIRYEEECNKIDGIWIIKFFRRWVIFFFFVISDSFAIM